MAQRSPLTNDERSRVLHFLRYPDWEALAFSIQLGFPAASQPLYLVEGAFDRLTDAGVESVRRALCQLEDCERQIGTSRSRLKAEQVGNLKVNMKEGNQLKNELVWWALVLASDLGVGPNPFSAFELLGGSGRNARVSS